MKPTDFSLMSILLLLFFGGFAMTAEFSPHGNRQARLYGGSEAFLPHFSFMVFIKTPLQTQTETETEEEVENEAENEVGTCGGSIISTEKSNRTFWILTAARCFDRASGEDLTIVMGVSDLSDETNAKIMVLPIASIFIHPNYNKSSINVHDDLALIPLPDFSPLESSYEPIQLPGKNYLKFDHSFLPVSTVGWGEKGNGEVAKKLMYIHTNCRSDEFCRENDPDFDTSRLCTDGSKSRGICAGDFGSPLVGGPSNSKHRDLMVFGVASYRKGLCNGNDPSYFTRVVEYSDWIQSH